MLKEAYKHFYDLNLPSHKTASDSAEDLICDLYLYDTMVAGALDTLIHKGTPLPEMLSYDNEIEENMTRILYSGTLNVSDSFIIISALNYLNGIKYLLFLAGNELRSRKEK
jgi:hypothetical protein